MTNRVPPLAPAPIILVVLFHELPEGIELALRDVLYVPALSMSVSPDASLPTPVEYEQGEDGEHVEPEPEGEA
ncbi:MAG: hypothetical protein UX97_C0019G0010 [Candidatus Beckwithbacteria bacterium GW2011_GWA2_47_25]|nr:MAG: hypothetical protein UX97_C0019G0010 [Candidatus Beckwithbacteria bacterium GW2011_GWA2_47_25]